MGYLCLILVTFISINSLAAPRVNTSNGKSSVKQSSWLEYCKTLKNCNSWSRYLDPKSREFWREGNHMPDEGWILFAQDMNLESAKLFLIRGEIKARYLQNAMKLIDQAQIELVSEGLIKDRYNVVKTKVDQLRRKKASRVDKSSFKGLQYFFIYTSSCPHCKEMSKTLVGFPNVYPLQADKGKLIQFKGLKKSEYASKETLEKYAPSKVVPVLVIHDPNTNQALVVNGNKHSSEIVIASSELLRKRKG